MNLLNNPKIFSLFEVIRALKIRNIYNPQDLLYMYVAIGCVVIGFLALFFFIGKNELKLRKYHTWPFTCVVIALGSLLIYAIDKNYHITAEQASGPASANSFLKLFYMCDGIIILISFLISTSYEATNVLVFCVVQPLIIIGLAITVIKKQSRQLAILVVCAILLVGCDLGPIAAADEQYIPIKQVSTGRVDTLCYYFTEYKTGDTIDVYKRKGSTIYLDPADVTNTAKTKVVKAIVLERP